MSEPFDVDALDDTEPFEVGGRVLIVPLAPSRSGDPSKCRPIGCYEASSDLAATYRRDRDER